MNFRFFFRFYCKLGKGKPRRRKCEPTDCWWRGLCSATQILDNFPASGQALRWNV
jgi:hypothetical protein